jgi:hypothetical protein
MDLAPAARVIPLTGMARPESVKAGKDYVYIVDFPSIHIFDKRDFKKIGAFGKRGEGPGEFNQFAGTHPKGDQLVICNHIKALFFTPRGKYIKEKKLRNQIWRQLTPVGNGFVAKGRFVENDTDYISLELYDSGLKRLKRLLKYKFHFQGESDKIYMLDYRNIQFITHQGKIYVKPDHAKFIIDVYDSAGNKEYSIKRDYEKIATTGAHLQKYHDYYRYSPRLKKFYENIKQRIAVPSFFPAIRTFTIADGKIYVVTYKEKQKNSEVLVLDLKGKFLKKIFLPLFDREEVFFRSIDYSFLRRLRIPLNSSTDSDAIVHLL